MYCVDFNYDRDYNNVMMVSRLDYERCNSTNPLVTYDDGASNFTLNRAGTFYFLSGIALHCRLGQRLAVHVRKHPLRSSQPTNSSISPSPANDNTNTNTNIPPPSYEDANDAPHLVETNIAFMTMSISLLLISMLTFMSVWVHAMLLPSFTYFAQFSNEDMIVICTTSMM